VIVERTERGRRVGPFIVGRWFVVWVRGGLLRRMGRPKMLEVRVLNPAGLNTGDYDDDED
jgi:hypothetical protein